MRTVDEVRVALGELAPAEAEELNANLLDQVPLRRVGDTQTVLVLAALDRALPLDVVAETEPADGERLRSLLIGLDGAWSDGGEVGEPDGRAARRMRFGSRNDAASRVQLCAVQLRLAVPGTIRLTRLAIEPAA
ncbi:hypothetical protein [Acuticoccus sp. I52.16.1]|uniref:hypothetical protein n=1 Tax=Acuticoccus sp. I52.16.1 TaxID=2928472 RepID=UPI001FD2DBB8|nr:hypothetical protein [Acuticoccus sp. I52.16.1]UOM37202.1 hypothetical protein MRB58_23865 [Acuticoccus sp. I52.16.1]